DEQDSRGMHTGKVRCQHRRVTRAIGARVVVEQLPGKPERRLGIIECRRGGAGERGLGLELVVLEDGRRHQRDPGNRCVLASLRTGEQHASERRATHRRGVPSVLMVGKPDRDRLRSLVEPHWRRLYNFVFRLTLDRDRAERYLTDIFTAATTQLDQAPATAPEVEIWLLGLANQMLEERLPRQPEVNFDILDETLRSEATRTDVVRSLSDPQRDFLLW